MTFLSPLSSEAASLAVRTTALDEMRQGGEGTSARSSLRMGMTAQEYQMTHKDKEQRRKRYLRNNLHELCARIHSIQTDTLGHVLKRLGPESLLAHDPSNNGATPLHVLCQNVNGQHLYALELFLASARCEEVVNLTNDSGYTPLFLLLQNPNVNEHMIEMFRTMHPNTFVCQGPFGQTALHMLVQNVSLHQAALDACLAAPGLAALLAQQDRTKRGRTVAHYLACSNAISAGLLQTLIDSAGTDCMRVLDRSGDSPSDLLLSNENGMTISILQVAASVGKFGIEALSRACSNTKLTREALEFILDHSDPSAISRALVDGYDGPGHALAGNPATSSQLFSLLRSQYPSCLTCADQHGDTPLHIVCANDRGISASIVRFFRESTLPLQAKDFHGETFLHILARSSRLSSEIVEAAMEIILGDSDVMRIATHDGRTFWHILCQNESINSQIVSNLDTLPDICQHLAAVDIDNRLPLHFACMNHKGRADWIIMIIRTGGTILAQGRDSEGMTAFDLLLRNQGIAYKELHLIANYFIEAGVIPRIVNRFIWTRATPLHKIGVMIKQGEDYAKFIEQRPYWLRAQHPKSWATPLSIYAGSRHVRQNVIELLLGHPDACITLEHQDKYGENPLHRICGNTHVPDLSALLLIIASKPGGSVAAAQTDINQRTPLSMLCGAGHAAKLLPSLIATFESFAMHRDSLLHLDETGKTALHRLCEAKNASAQAIGSMIRLYGAENFNEVMYMRDHRGRNPLGCLFCRETPPATEEFEMLLAHKDVHAALLQEDENGVSPMVALVRRHQDTQVALSLMNSALALWSSCQSTHEHQEIAQAFESGLSPPLAMVVAQDRDHLDQIGNAASKAVVQAASTGETNRRTVIKQIVQAGASKYTPAYRISSDTCESVVRKVLKQVPICNKPDSKMSPVSGSDHCNLEEIDGALENVKRVLEWHFVINNRIDFSYPYAAYSLPSLDSYIFSASDLHHPSGRRNMSVFVAVESMRDEQKEGADASDHDILMSPLHVVPWEREQVDSTSGFRLPGLSIPSHIYIADPIICSLTNMMRGMNCCGTELLQKYCRDAILSLCHCVRHRWVPAVISPRMFVVTRASNRMRLVTPRNYLVRLNSKHRGILNAFCPPEYASQSSKQGFIAVTEAALVWQMGAIIFEMFSGRPLFAYRCNDFTLIHDSTRPKFPEENSSSQIMSHEYLAYLQGSSDDSMLREICSSCLHGDPNHRPTFSDLLNHCFFSSAAACGDTVSVKLEQNVNNDLHRLVESPGGTSIAVLIFVQKTSQNPGARYAAADLLMVKAALLKRGYKVFEVAGAEATLLGVKRLLSEVRHYVNASPCSRSIFYLSGQGFVDMAGDTWFACAKASLDCMESTMVECFGLLRFSKRWSAMLGHQLWLLDFEHGDRMQCLPYKPEMHGSFDMNAPPEQVAQSIYVWPVDGRSLSFRGHSIMTTGLCKCLGQSESIVTSHSILKFILNAQKRGLGGREQCDDCKEPILLPLQGFSYAGDIKL